MNGDGAEKMAIKSCTHISTIKEDGSNKYERNVKKRDKAVRLVFYWVGSGERGINNKRVGAVLQSGSQTHYTTYTCLLYTSRCV